MHTKNRADSGEQAPCVGGNLSPFGFRNRRHKNNITKGRLNACAHTKSTQAKTVQRLTAFDACDVCVKICKSVRVPDYFRVCMRTNYTLIHSYLLPVYLFRLSSLFPLCVRLVLAPASSLHSPFPCLSLPSSYPPSKTNAQTLMLRRTSIPLTLPPSQNRKYHYRTV